MYTLEHSGRWFRKDNCLSEKIEYTKLECFFSIYTKYIRNIFFSFPIYYQGFYTTPGKCDCIHLNGNQLAKIFMKTDLV